MIKITTRNLLDKDKVKPGYLNGTGTISIASSLLEGFFTIPVIPNKNYTISYTHEHTNENDRIGYGFFSDASLTNMIGSRYSETIQSHTGYTRVIKVPNNTHISFMVFSTRFLGKDINKNIQLELGTEATPYIPHLLEVDRIVQTTRNLFDKDAEPYINDVFIKWNGITTPEIGYAVYKIPITKGTYTITHTSMVISPGYVIYDSNDNIISGDAYSKRGVFTFDAPDNSDYILVSVVYDVDGANAFRRDIDFFQLELGTEATPYVPHLLEVSSIQQKTEDGIEIAFEEGDS